MPRVAQSLAVTQLGGSAPTPPNGIEAEIVRVSDLEQLEGIDDKDVRGRIVYIAAKLERDESFASYGKIVAGRVMGAISAAKKGAVAVLVRSVGTDNDRAPHAGSVKNPEPADGVPAIPAGAISAPDAEMLDRLYDIKKTLRVRLKLSGHRVADGASANVIGEITGREKPDEIVLLAAHLDSWDLGRGALDDGGVGVVLGAAHVIMRHRAPRRTLRIALFTAEEMSGSGAKQYALDHQKELDRHVAAIEADAGDGDVLRGRWLGSLDGDRLAAELARSLGFAELEPAATGGADLAPLRAAGVPVVDLAQDVSTYFDLHHSANDTFDKVEPDSLTRVTSAFAVAAWTLAESELTLGPVPLDKRTRGR